MSRDTTAGKLEATAEEMNADSPLLYRLIGEEAPLFEHLLRCHGFEPTLENDWNLLWISPGVSSRQYDELRRQMKPLQNCNRFPALESALQQHLMWKLMPNGSTLECFQLPAQRQELLNSFQRTFASRPLWSVFGAKSPCRRTHDRLHLLPGSMGESQMKQQRQPIRSILLFQTTNLNELLSCEGVYYVSRALQHPLLLDIDDSRSDEFKTQTMRQGIRCCKMKSQISVTLFSLVTCFDPLRAYAYSHGLTHIHENSTVSVGSLDWISSRLGSNAWIHKALNIIRIALMRLQPTVSAELSSGAQGDGECFQILSCVFDLDSQERPHLRQIVAVPDLNCVSEKHYKLNAQMLIDALNIVGVSQSIEPEESELSHHHHPQQPKKCKSQKRLQKSKKKVCSSPAPSVFMFGRKGTDFGVKMELARVLQHSRDERKRARSTKFEHTLLPLAPDQWKQMGHHLRTPAQPLNHFLSISIFGLPKPISVLSSGVDASGKKQKPRAKEHTKQDVTQTIRVQGQTKRTLQTAHGRNQKKVQASVQHRMEIMSRYLSMHPDRPASVL